MTTFFKLMFWLSQVMLGFPSVLIAIDLITKGKADGIINGIGLLLAWIGATLVWGLATLMSNTSQHATPSIATASTTPPPRATPSYSADWGKQ